MGEPVPTMPATTGKKPAVSMPHRNTHAPSSPPTPPTRSACTSGGTSSGAPGCAGDLAAAGNEREQAAEAVHRQAQHRPEADHVRQELRKACPVSPAPSIADRAHPRAATTSADPASHHRMPYACPHMRPDPAVRTRAPNPRPNSRPRTPLINTWTGQPVAGAANSPGHASAQHPGDRPGQQTIARHDRTSRSDSASKLMVCTMSGGKNTSRTQSSSTRNRFSRLGSFDR